MQYSVVPVIFTYFASISRRLEPVICSSPVHVRDE